MSYFRSTVQQVLFFGTQYHIIINDMEIQIISIPFKLRCAICNQSLCTTPAPSNIAWILKLFFLIMQVNATAHSCMIFFLRLMLLICSHVAHVCYYPFLLLLPRDTPQLGHPTGDWGLCCFVFVNEMTITIYAYDLIHIYLHHFTTNNQTCVCWMGCWWHTKLPQLNVKHFTNWILRYKTYRRKDTKEPLSCNFRNCFLHWKAKHKLLNVYKFESIKYKSSGLWS